MQTKPELKERGQKVSLDIPRGTDRAQLRRVLNAAARKHIETHLDWIERQCNACQSDRQPAKAIVIVNVFIAPGQPELFKSEETKPCEA